jgi:hypothetical protein
VKAALLFLACSALAGQICLATDEGKQKAEQKAMAITRELLAGKRLPYLSKAAVNSWQGQSSSPMQKIDFDFLRSALSGCEAITSRGNFRNEGNQPVHKVYVNLLCKERPDGKRHASLTFFFDGTEISEIQLGDKIIIITVGMPSDETGAQD